VTPLTTERLRLLSHLRLLPATPPRGPSVEMDTDVRYGIEEDLVPGAEVPCPLCGTVPYGWLDVRNWYR